MKKLLTYTCLLLFFLTTLAFGGGLPRAMMAEEVGVSAERLERIRPVMQAYVDDGLLPGILTVVARHGKIVHFETVGMGDIENNRPVEPDTIFRIYSMTKPVTSVAVMMLYEEGRFQLNTPVSRFIPEFANMKVYNKDQTEISDTKNEITVKHLLMHTAGLTYGWGSKPIDQRYREAKLFEEGTTLKDMARKLADIPLAHEPGERWTYGVSTDLLGYFVEAVSGVPFAEFLETRIFEPLGMVDTAFWVPPEKMDRFAALYTFNRGDEGKKEEQKKETDEKAKHKEGDGEKDSSEKEKAKKDSSKKEGTKKKAHGKGRLERAGKDGSAAFSDKNVIPSGGGGLVSTAADYMRFSQMLLNGGELDGVRILGKKTVELMRYPHHDDWFGLGFAVVNDKKAPDTLESVGNFSWGGAASTTFWIDPEEDLIGLFLIQIFNSPYPFRAQFKTLTYQALIE